MGGNRSAGRCPTWFSWWAHLPGSRQVSRSNSAIESSAPGIFLLNATCRSISTRSPLRKVRPYRRTTNSGLSKPRADADCKVSSALFKSPRERASSILWESRRRAGSPLCSGKGHPSFKRALPCVRHSLENETPRDRAPSRRSRCRTTATSCTELHLHLPSQATSAGRQA